MHRVPRTVHCAVAAWLAAVVAGVAETVVRTASSDPPVGTELGVRAGVYVAVAALVLALPTGRRGVRTAVTVLLGVLGLVSLLVEPVRWWLEGGAVSRFLAEADVVTSAVLACRVLHLLAVLAGLVLLRLPSANAFFAPRGDVAATAGRDVTPAR